jgi:hypothetical protein
LTEKLQKYGKIIFGPLELTCAIHHIQSSRINCCQNISTFHNFKNHFKIKKIPNTLFFKSSAANFCYYNFKTFKKTFLEIKCCYFYASNDFEESL